MVSAHTEPASAKARMMRSMTGLSAEGGRRRAQTVKLKLRSRRCERRDRREGGERGACVAFETPQCVVKRQGRLQTVLTVTGSVTGE
eukprot:scaffold46028_cov55-Phaeocystis_antarctica.AAC.7